MNIYDAKNASFFAFEAMIRTWSIDLLFQSNLCDTQLSSFCIVQLNVNVYLQYTYQNFKILKVSEVFDIDLD